MLRWIENLLLVGLLGGLVLLASAQIVLRNFFSTGLTWADGLVRLMVLWLERSANAIDQAEARDRFARHASDLGLRRVPRLAAHDRLFVPISTSVFRPAILLPADWPDWSPTKLDAVLIHELAHVARHDMFVRRLSLIYRALFWFNPLSWWLHHRITVLGERASDEATLASGIDQAAYAETLLEFFRAPQHPRLASWHVAMARGRGAERRVDWILDWEAPMTRRAKSTIVLLALLLVPTAIAAAVTRPVARPGPIAESDPQLADIAAPIAATVDAPTRPAAALPAVRSYNERQSAPRTQPSRATAIATPQRGAPVTLLDARYDDAARRMLAVQVRNDSTSVVRAIVLATVVRFDAAAEVPAAFRGAGFASEHALAGAAETSPKSFAISWATMTMRLDPAAQFSMTVRLPDPSMEAAIAAGAKVELGVVRVEFVEGAPWTYDVKAAGGFERAIRHDTQDGQDQIYAPDTPGLVLPTAVERANARYTAEALRRKIQGTVEVEVIVREDGSVGAVRVVKSLDPTYGLDDTAVAAAQGFRFTPATLNGKPVRVLCNLSIEYRLH